jgi:carnosine N-methyltransferase
MGYSAQGNEFSYFMLLASNFLLNHTAKAKQFTIHPYIHSFSNNFKEEDAFTAINIPDVSPADMIKPGTDFSMVAGEFVEVYRKQKGEWDSVVTCFFIDTANNIIEYVRTIYEALMSGGVWINIGPLLYHYADMEGEQSIEISWEEIKYIVENIGFEIKVINNFY